jgi:hypothetical protein
MEFTFDIGLLGLTTLVVGAVLFGVGIQLLGNAHLRYEWLLTAIVAGIGAFIASEFVVAFQTWEPIFDGLAVVPAAAVGAVAGLIAAGASRYVLPEQIAHPVD